MSSRDKNITLRQKMLSIGLFSSRFMARAIVSSIIVLNIAILGGTVDTSALTYQSKTGISFTFDSSINITLSNPDLIISELAPGTVANSNEINVNVLTNNANGYTLNTTVGSNTVANPNGAIYNTRALIHSTYTNTDNTAISNNTGTKPTFDSIAYGASMNTITDDNTWGYSYLDPGTNGINTTWSNYSGLPLYSDTEHIATLKESTTTSAETGDNVKFKIAAKASTGQTSGEYNNVINFIVVGAPDDLAPAPQTSPAGCISYFPNASNVEGTMGCQSISSSATSATLLASNFSKEGYGFAGWSDRYDYMTNQNAKFYGPNETITFEAGQYTSPNNGLSLYAVWVKSQGNLQDSTKVASICNSLTAATGTGANLSSVSALTDQRDGNTYAIAKLADGNCWMIENLRLESADTVGNNRFDSSATNQSLAQGYGASTTYGNFSGLANAESADFSNSTTANSLYYSGTQSGTASINIGTSDYPGYRMPRYNNTNTSARANSPTSNGSSMYSYGNYYTWHAAIADLTYNGTKNQSTTGTSLCPTGWHLPQGGRKANVDVSEFWKLSRAIIGANPANFSSDNFYYTDTPEGSDASNKLRTYPNNFLYSGYFTGSLARNRGSYGMYWSSTAFDYYNSYRLSLYSSSVYPGTGVYNKYSGQSVRCVAGS